MRSLSWNPAHSCIHRCCCKLRSSKSLGRSCSQPSVAGVAAFHLRIKNLHWAPHQFHGIFHGKQKRTAHESLWEEINMIGIRSLVHEIRRFGTTFVFCLFYRELWFLKYPFKETLKNHTIYGSQFLVTFFWRKSPNGIPNSFKWWTMVSSSREDTENQDKIALMQKFRRLRVVLILKVGEP